ncbi:MAG TPA: hypothetical protein VMI15_01075 [Burkholderiales bacterium]|nr:hypothetical protein [Burkholderiales bacterium]
MAGARGGPELIRRLGAGSPAARRDAIAEALKRPGGHNPPVLYALANALAREPKRGEEAVFWYHVGRLRAVYDALRCRDKAARQSVAALGRSMSEALRQRQRDDPVKTLLIAKRALKWDRTHPRDYDLRWVGYHPGLRRKSGAPPELDTYDEKDWPDILRYVHETHLRSVELFTETEAGK